MAKPTIEDRTKARDERVAERAARREAFAEEVSDQRDQTRRGHLRRQASERLLLRSPSMAVFELTVDDKGKLTTREVVPAELAPRP